MRTVCFLILCLLSNGSLAQVALEKGQQAPETGVFLTKEQAAKIIAEKQAAAEICKINQDAAVSLEKNKCDYEKNLLKNELSYEKSKFDEISKLRDVQEERLYETLSDSGSNLYWFVGGVAVGTTIATAGAISIVFFVNQVNP
jgi:hypothetical protein